MHSVYYTEIFLNIPSCHPIKQRGKRKREIKRQTDRKGYSNLDKIQNSHFCNFDKSIF